MSWSNQNNENSSQHNKGSNGNGNDDKEYSYKGNGEFLKKKRDGQAPYNRNTNINNHGEVLPYQYIKKEVSIKGDFKYYESENESRKPREYKENNNQDNPNNKRKGFNNGNIIDSTNFDSAFDNSNFSNDNKSVKASVYNKSVINTNSNNTGYNDMTANNDTKSCKSNVNKNNFSSYNHNFLPIEKNKSEIVATIKENQVSIICGETGCGKTTKVPQYIYTDCKFSNQEPNILITQPRRIAAISIANRLREEMEPRTSKNNPNSIIGYHVGMDPKFNNNTKILIVTTGIFLQRLINEKSINEFTHIIIDEVHERDIDIDFVLVIIKHYLINSKTKLILMSATISTHLFANYFSAGDIRKIELIDYYKSRRHEYNRNIEDNDQDEYGWRIHKNREMFEQKKQSYLEHIRQLDEDIQRGQAKGEALNYSKPNLGITDKAPVVMISDKIFQVKIFYLDEIVKRIDNDLREKRYGGLRFNLDKKSAKIEQEIYQVGAELINLICIGNVMKNEDSTNSILVFLPGVGEIHMFTEEILRALKTQEVEIMHLHSNVTDDQQKQIFIKTNKRKIILSTNIAESSITIPDVYFVIDFCLVKELRCNYKNSTESLLINWASKASCNQRAGRAGRVKEGMVFRLVTDFFYLQLEDFSTPEISRCPLEKLILKIKVWDKDEPLPILGRTIEPPKQENIKKALDNLLNNGALTVPTGENVTGKLTPIGKVFAELPIDIRFSRLIMLCFAMDMVEPGIVLASVLSQDKGIIRIEPNNYEELDFLKSIDLGCHSDILAMFNFYKWWERNFSNKKKENNEFDRRLCRVNRETMDWCRERLSKDYSLSEVERTIADLKSRLNKLGLYETEEVKRYEVFSGYVESPNLLLFKLREENSLRFLKDKRKREREEEKYGKSQPDKRRDGRNERFSIINRNQILRDILGIEKLKDDENEEEKEKEVRDDNISDSAERSNKKESLKVKSILDNYSPSELLFMKIIIAGAFHGKYLTCNYRDLDKFAKTKTNFDKNYDIVRTIRVKNLPEDLKEIELIQYIESYFLVKVEKSNLITGEALLMFAYNSQEELSHKEFSAEGEVFSQDKIIYNSASPVESSNNTNKPRPLSQTLSFLKPITTNNTLSTSIITDTVKTNPYFNRNLIQDKNYYKLLVMKETISNLITVINTTSHFDDYYRKIRNIKFPSNPSNLNNKLNNFRSKTTAHDMDISKPRLSHHFQIVNNDFFNDSEIIISNASVNSDPIEPQESKVHKTFLVAEEIYFRNNKSSIARKTTLMPESEMGDLLLILIFAPQVTFFPNMEGTRYEGFQTIDSEKEFRFPYLFGSNDVDEINNVRSCFNIIVENLKGKSVIQANKKLLKEKMLAIWTKKRIKIIKNTEWWKLFYQYFPDERKNQYLAHYPGMNESNEEDEMLLQIKTESECRQLNQNDDMGSKGESKFKIEKSQQGYSNNTNLLKSTVIQKTTKEDNDFLPRLLKLDIKEDYRLWSKNGLIELQKERDKFGLMKFKLEKSLKEKRNLCLRDTAQVYCRQCDSFVTEIKQLKVINEKTKNIYEVIGYISGFVEYISNESMDMESFADDPWMQKFKKITLPKPENFMFCRQRHLLGFNFQGKSFITTFSDVEVRYPTEIVEKIEDDLQSMKEKEKFYNKMRVDKVKDLNCELCEESMKTSEAFMKHAANPSHKRMLNELLEECFY